MDILEISSSDLASLLGVVSIGTYAAAELDKRKLLFREISPSELRQFNSRVEEYLSSSVQPSGMTYQEKWDIGWNESLQEFRNDNSFSSLIPKFVRKGLPIRFQGRWIMPLTDSFETDFVFILRAHLYETYLSGVDTLIEFGAGTGHNLVHLHDLGVPRVLGFDWSESSVQLMSEISLDMSIPLESYRFDMFSPVIPESIDFGNNYAILTVGAMEQLGTQWNSFLHFLLECRPQVVIHLETNYEDLDENISFEASPRQYIRKRNWLQGYFQALKSLSSKGTISEFNVTRTFGSFYHDGYTLSTWRPEVLPHL